MDLHGYGLEDSETKLEILILATPEEKNELLTRWYNESPEKFKEWLEFYKCVEGEDCLKGTSLEKLNL